MQSAHFLPIGRARCPGAPVSTAGARAEQDLERVEKHVGVWGLWLVSMKGKVPREQCRGLCPPLQHCMAWCAIARCNVAWHSMAWCGISWHCTAQHGVAQHFLAFHSATCHCTAFLGIAQCIVALHNVEWCSVGLWGQMLRVSLLGCSWMHPAAAAEVPQFIPLPRCFRSN